MLFDLGDEVRIIATGETGVVKQLKYDKYILNGRLKEVCQYDIDTGKKSYYGNWVDESKLEPLFTNEFEMGFLDLIIDVNLLDNKFHFAKQFLDEKRKRAK